jgi:hypothetical protein
LRRLRGRLNRTETIHQQAVVVQRHVRAAIGLLDWPTGGGFTVASAPKPTLTPGSLATTPLIAAKPGTLSAGLYFHKLTGLELPAAPWNGPSGPKRRMNRPVARSSGLRASSRDGNA